MNETALVILGCLLTFLLAAMLAAITWLVSTVIQMGKDIVKLQTISTLYSERVATVLHSPHTPEMDALLEKFRDEYIRRHGELSREEWQRLAEMTEEIINDSEIPKGERQCAAWINAVCAHKLLKDPKPLKRIE